MIVYDRYVNVSCLSNDSKRVGQRLKPVPQLDFAETIRHRDCKNRERTTALVERNAVLMAALPKPEVKDLRPSIVIAEALVDRHGPTEIVDRARQLGFSRNLTMAVVGACCRGSVAKETSARAPRPTPWPAILAFQFYRGHSTSRKRGGSCLPVCVSVISPQRVASKRHPAAASGRPVPIGTSVFYFV